MNGSRVLLTTRRVDVARFADPDTCPFDLPLLTPDQSRELFTSIVFRSSSVPCELKELVERMVKRCAGLPLALAVLGGSFSTVPRTSHAWMRLDERMHWGPTQEVDRLMKVLALSYRSLPNIHLPDIHLRSCFLYISSFPEDSEISASELARLWIAEGFIPHEDRAKDYLEEFVQRCMLQVVERRLDGSVKTCRIHDRIREMCLIEAKHNRFLDIIPGGTSSEHVISSTRRLTLENLTEDDCSRSDLPPNLRSFFLRSPLFFTHGPLRILHDLKLLRVLDLSGLYALLSFPKEIEIMGHLRYLKFRQHADVEFCIYEFPWSIGKLQNLQTLDMRGLNIISSLPKELGELPMLTHLFINETSNTHVPQFTTTTNLQTLKWVSADQLWVEESLPRLTSLQRLSIELSQDAMTVFDSLGKLRHLHSLSIVTYDLSIISHDLPIGTAVTALSHNHLLQKLYLRGCWAPQRSLPESNRFPPNLAKLTLDESKLEDDPMPVLEKLPNLVYLKLCDAYNGTNMVCTKSGFPRLQNLLLYRIRTVKDWTVEVGAFPTLTYLIISDLTNLAMLPEAFQHITTLRELTVYDSLYGRLTKDVGEDWHKIQHVPTIIIKYF